MYKKHTFVDENYSNGFGHRVNKSDKMKFLVFLFFIVGCALAHNVHRRGAEETAEIKEHNSAIQPDGNFEYNFDTSNGISARALGTPKQLGGNPPEIAESISGTFSWTAPDGKLVKVEYTADENGYHPKVVL